jgi:hypothetical protein
MQLDKDIKHGCYRKTQKRIPAEESSHSFDEEKSGIRKPDTHPQLMDERRNDKCSCGQYFISVFLLEKTPVKKIESAKTHKLKGGKVEVDTTVLRYPHTQGKDNGSPKTDRSIEQLLSHEIDHRDKSDRAQDTDQPEIEHRESEDLGKKCRNIRIKNGFVIDVPGREKRITKVQDLLGRQIVESFIHPQREGIQRSDKKKKDKDTKKGETCPCQKVSFLLNFSGQKSVQQLVLIQGPG